MLVIRADGNKKIGAGHLMRCLTIADAVAGMGGRVSFCCSDRESAALAEERGYAARVLEGDYRQIEGEKPWWEELAGEEAYTVLVDSYYAGTEYFQRIRESGRVERLVRIEDNPHPTETYPADVLINYNVFAEREAYDSLYRGKGTRCLIGGAYVPLRGQFTGAEYTVREKAARILITTGGGDLCNIAGRILERIYEKGREYVVVSGAFNPHMESLRELERRLGNVRLVRNAANMAALMREADIAVSAGGTTVYELCAVGTPFVAFACADNQEALAACVGELEAGIGGGNYHIDEEDCLARIEQAVRELEKNKGLRRRLSRRQRALVDGLGAKRIGEIILA